MSGPNDPEIDNDSAYGGSIRGSLTISLTTSIYDYHQEYGRLYHARSRRYLYPIDQKEMERLDLQHELFYKVLDARHFLAPISSTPQNVLDLGTGSGIWAIDIADLYPSARVLGIDLSPTQPSEVPTNCKFQIDDVNLPWGFERSFDFIHSRRLHMNPTLMQQASEALQLGGWLEVKDMPVLFTCNDDSLQGTALQFWHSEMMKASRLLETPFEEPYQYRKWMEEARFVNVKEYFYRILVNDWCDDPKAKEVGTHQMVNLYEGLEGFSLLIFTQVLKWSREELEVLLVQVKRDLRNRKIRAYCTLIAVIGQKPSFENREPC